MTTPRFETKPISEFGLTDTPDSFYAEELDRDYAEYEAKLADERVNDL